MGEGFGRDAEEREKESVRVKDENVERKKKGERGAHRILATSKFNSLVRLTSAAVEPVLHNSAAP